MSQANNDPAGFPYRLQLLGPPSLTDAEGGLVHGLGPGKPLAMLSYLAIHGPALREDLVSLLWPEMPEDRARNAFRQTLHRVRGALGEEILATDRETIAVIIGDRLWCDAADFQRSVSAEPRRAVGLYRGPFLGGLNVGSAPFEQWAEGQRERFEAQYRGALTTVINLSTETGKRDDAVEHARLLSRVAPLDPQAAILEAKVLVTAGRKPEAISVLTQHVSKMESELGAKPAAAVTTLLQRLLGDAVSPGAAPTPTSDLLPEAEFVGREAELGQLLGLWRTIEQRGAVAMVTGESGIGRTRLLREFVQRIAVFAPALLLWGQERHGNRRIPYAALADALRPAVNAPGVAGASQSLLAEAARLLPEIRDQFNLPDAGPLDDEAARIRFFDGVASLLDAVAFEQPVCLVVEDLHHASRSSVELLHFLTQRLAKAPVLFLVSYRPAEAPQYVLERFAPPATRDRAVVTVSDSDPAASHLSLGELDDDAVTRMIGSVTIPGEIDADTMSSIVAVAEGNPFRALDLVRRVRRGEPIVSLPVEVAQTLWARLQSCSPQEQRLFLACALLGRPARLRLLAAATHLAEPVAFDAALALEMRGLIVQQRGGVAPAHDILTAIALEGTGSAGRALLAGWTADALASEAGSSNAELAQLYAEAGQPSSAHKYARAAVLDAAASGASEELDNLLALASQTALSSDDRRAVQSLRTALQGDARRLGRGRAAEVEVSISDAGVAQAVPVAPATEQNATGPATPPGRLGKRYLALARRRPLQVAAVGLLAVFASAALLQKQSARPGARGTVLGDSVLVAERVGVRATRLFLVTGSILPSAALQDARARTEPEWIEDLALPWTNPRVSPDARYVALEHITPEGTNIHVVSANQRDTIPIAVGTGDDLIAGWSPDARWLLVIHESGEGDGYRSSLHAYSLSDPGATVALDTASRHAVVDAAWSPTGMQVAWTARIGSTRQQDVFVATGDGRGALNVTASESEDYHPAWSPEGERLVFTSDRGSDAEIYSVELATNELRRLTFNAAQDDRALFSPDGDFIAFESTRNGHVGVYAMHPFGGSVRRLTPAQRNFELVGWRGRAPGYLADFRIVAPVSLAPGASAAVTATATDQYGARIALPAIQWAALDNTAGLQDDGRGADTRSTGRRTIVGRRAGLARIVATAGAWRADTAFTLIGAVPLTILSEDFSAGISRDRWTALGEPRPEVVAGAGTDGGAGLVLRSDRQWESGVLGANVFPLRPGLSVSARVRAPFSSRGQPGGFTFALVAAEAASSIDPSAPQFLRVAALSWLPEAGRLAYSAEREFWSEVVRFARGDGWHTFRIEVEADGRVAFYVEGQLRRRSGIVVTGNDGDSRVQLWVGGRATSDAVVVDDVKVWIADVR